jgi:hypothetical protein
MLAESLQSDALTGNGSASEAVRAANVAARAARDLKETVKGKPAAARQDLATILSGVSWRSQCTVLITIMGEELTGDERRVFAALTNREREPGEFVEEFWGSSAVAAESPDVTVIGEKPTVLVLAQNVRQAGILLAYIGGILGSVDLLKRLVKNRTQDRIELHNGITIEVRPAISREPRDHKRRLHLR